jgi:hypothetical protein
MLFVLIYFISYTYYYFYFPRSWLHPSLPYDLHRHVGLIYIFIEEALENVPRFGKAQGPLIFFIAVRSAPVMFADALLFIRSSARAQLRLAVAFNVKIQTIRSNPDRRSSRVCDRCPLEGASRPP